MRSFLSAPWGYPVCIVYSISVYFPVWITPSGDGLPVRQRSKTVRASSQPANMLAIQAGREPPSDTITRIEEQRYRFNGTDCRNDCLLLSPFDGIL